MAKTKTSFSKDNPGPGRPKGTKNKAPADLRGMVISVANQLHPDGLEAALLEWAKKSRNEGVFWTRMIAPLMPKVVEATITDNDDAGKLERAKARLNGGV